MPDPAADQIAELFKVSHPNRLSSAVEKVSNERVHTFAGVQRHLLLAQVVVPGELRHYALPGGLKERHDQVCTLAIYLALCQPVRLLNFDWSGGRALDVSSGEIDLYNFFAIAGCKEKAESVSLKC